MFWLLRGWARQLGWRLRLSISARLDEVFQTSNSVIEFLQHCLHLIISLGELSVDAETTVCNREEITCCRRSSKVGYESPRCAPPWLLLPLPLSIGSQRKVVLQPADELWTVGVNISRRLYSRSKRCLPPLWFGIRQQSWTFQASSSMPTTNQNGNYEVSTTVFWGNDTNSITTTRPLPRFNRHWIISPLFRISPTRTKRRHHCFKSFAPQSTDRRRRTHRRRWRLCWRICVPHNSWSRQRAKWLLYVDIFFTSWSNWVYIR